MRHNAPLPPERKLKKGPPAPVDERAEYVRPFAPHGNRRAGRQSLERQLSGLRADLDGKNGAPIATAVAGPHSQRLPAVLTALQWQETAVNTQRVPQLTREAPAGAGVVLCADPGMPTQGPASGGVARPYAGTLGQGGKTVKGWWRVRMRRRAARGQSRRASPCTRAGPRRRRGVRGRRSRQRTGRLPPSPSLP